MASENHAASSTVRLPLVKAADNLAAMTYAHDSAGDPPDNTQPEDRLADGALPDDDAFEEALSRAGEGDTDAQKRLWEKYYPVFRQCAKAWFARRWTSDISLDGTDIVNMVYARLHARVRAMTNGRAYFFRAFYEECLRVVLDHYRKHPRGKRVELPEDLPAGTIFNAIPQRLHDIIEELRPTSPRMALIAKLKVFGEAAVTGKETSRPLSNQEVAELVGYSLRLVEEEWPLAKAHILKRLKQDSQ